MTPPVVYSLSVVAEFDDIISKYIILYVICAIYYNDGLIYYNTVNMSSTNLVLLYS